MSMTEQPRRRILIVEDEMLIAMLVEQMVLDLGYDVVGPAVSVDEALRFTQTDVIDCAILDMNLGRGAVSTPIALVLESRGIPYILASGYGATQTSRGHRATTVLNKPFLTDDLEKALRQIFPV